MTPTAKALENVKNQIPSSAFDIWTDVEMPMTPNHFTLCYSLNRYGMVVEVVVHATIKTGKISKATRYNPKGFEEAKAKALNEIAAQ